MTTEGPHDRRRYQRGCRCADCCAANRAYARQHRRDKQSRLRAVPPPPATAEFLDGPVTEAIRAQFDGTVIAQERPGLYAIAIRLAQLLDREDAVPQHPAAAHRLAVILGTLAQSSQRQGRLAVVRSMTGEAPKGSTSRPKSRPANGPGV